MIVTEKVKMFGLGAVAFVLTVECLDRLVQRLWARFGLQKPVKEVLFFPVNITCVEHLFKPSVNLTFSCPCPLPHDQESSFTRLLQHLLSATASLDLCVFAFSNQSLSRAVLHLHSCGVVVRVITDSDYMVINGSQISVLRRAGIDVRHELGAVHMHHKFAVVDGRLLITGSLNWTTTAIQSNKENVVVTEEPELVSPYVREFEQLWDANDPARRLHTN